MPTGFALCSEETPLAHALQLIIFVNVVVVGKLVMRMSLDSYLTFP